MRVHVVFIKSFVFFAAQQRQRNSSKNSVHSLLRIYSQNGFPENSQYAIHFCPLPHEVVVWSVRTHFKSNFIVAVVQLHAFTVCIGLVKTLCTIQNVLNGLNNYEQNPTPKFTAHCHLSFVSL